MPTKVDCDYWETELQKDSDQPRFAKKKESRQNKNLKNKVIPANQGAQQPALLDRKRKLIVEVRKDKKNTLNKNKE